MCGRYSWLGGPRPRRRSGMKTEIFFGRWWAVTRIVSLVAALHAMTAAVGSGKLAAPRDHDTNAAGRHQWGIYRHTEEESKEGVAGADDPTVDLHVSTTIQNELSEYTGWSPELLAGRDGDDGTGARRVVSGVAAPPGNILERTLSAYRKTSGEILKRWGREYAKTTLFSGGMEFSDGGKVVEDKMLNAVLRQESFLAVFTGVSTTAGHDDLYEQSYPIVLNGTLGRLMAAAGVRYEAINVAMGNTRVAPYSFCVDSLAGYDADIISWEMHMMVAGKHAAPPALELFIRSASVLPKRPAVLLTDASPVNTDCPKFDNGTRFRNDGLVAAGRDNDLMEVYSEFGLHRMTPSSLVPENTCGDELFDYHRLYNASLKDIPRPSSWHAGPLGHQLVADMLFMHYAEVFLKAVGRLEDVAPGITARQLRDSGGEIQPDDAAVSSSERDTRESIHDLTSLREILGLEVEAVDDNDSVYMGGGRGDILPPPAWCAGWRFCLGAGSYRCANTYFPQGAGRGTRLVGMVSAKSPAILNLDHKKMIAEPTSGHWAMTLNEESEPLLDYLKTFPPEGFHHPIDLKLVLVGDAASGAIEFEFETIGFPPGTEGWLFEKENEEEEEEEEEEEADRAEGLVDGNEDQEAAKEEKVDEGEEEAGSHRAMQDQPQQMNSMSQDSRVVICKPDFITRVDFTNSTQVTFRVDGVVALAEELEQGFMTQGSCVILEADVGVGRHTVSVEPLHSGAPYVAVSHLLYPA